MAVVIDKKIKVPLHYQIYLDLLKKIQTGVLKAGEKLPTEAELEEMYGVSRITVRGAIEMLAQSPFKNIVIDDFNYLSQDYYMANAMKGGWDRMCVPA